MKKISEIAKKYNITVRTLHHYDNIGLIVPERFNDIRMYSQVNEESLKRVLLFKNLDFSLKEIMKIIDDDLDFKVLLSKRESLINKREELNEIISMIDSYTIINNEPNNITELFNPFGSNIREIIGDKSLNEIVDNKSINFSNYISDVTAIFNSIKLNINDDVKMNDILDEYYFYFNSIMNNECSKIVFVDMVLEKFSYIENLTDIEKDRFALHLERYKYSG